MNKNKIPLPSSPNQDNGREAEKECGKCEMASRMAGFPDKCDEHSQPSFASKKQAAVKEEVSRTAMQELIEQLKGAISIIDKHGTLNDFAQDRKVVYTSVLDLATKLLELERKQIIVAYTLGFNDDTIDGGESFYNSKYNK